MTDRTDRADAARPRHFRWTGLLLGVAVGLLLGSCTPLGTAVRQGLTEIFPPPPPARVSDAQSEIAQLAMAIQSFKTKFNVVSIPDRFVLEADYTDPGSDQPSADYLKVVFPSLDLKKTGLPERKLDGNQTLVFFLTGGSVTNHEGFSISKTQPFAAEPRDTRLGPFLELRRSQLDPEERFLDPWGTPYVYFAFDAWQGTYSRTFLWKGWPIAPYRREGKYMNGKSFQIISAGPNHQFGPGGDWLPGEGPWSADGPGGDDISNFNNGPLSRLE
jgi:hypothetical protein